MSYPGSHHRHAHARHDRTSRSTSISTPHGTSSVGSVEQPHSHHTSSPHVMGTEMKGYGEQIPIPQADNEWNRIQFRDFTMPLQRPMLVTPSNSSTTPLSPLDLDISFHPSPSPSTSKLVNSSGLSHRMPQVPRTPTSDSDIGILKQQTQIREVFPSSTCSERSSSSLELSDKESEPDSDPPVLIEVDNGNGSQFAPIPSYWGTSAYRHANSGANGSSGQETQLEVMRIGPRPYEFNPEFYPNPTEKIQKKKKKWPRKISKNAQISGEKLR